MKTILIMGNKIVAGSAVVTVMLMGSTAFAAANPNGTGQPSADCESSASAPQGFSTGGFANAETKYAGSEGTPSLAHGNAKAVSQYDVACYQLSN